jgi:hypothetical protein
MKEFRAAADIEVLLLFDSAKLKSSSSEDVSVSDTNLGIVGKGRKLIFVCEKSIWVIRPCRRFGFFSPVANYLRSDKFEKLYGGEIVRLKY